jgi:hypothetical protein
MNKRKKKKQVHKMCIKYQDGCGVIPMLRNPNIVTGKINTCKIFNEYVFFQDRGLDFPVDILYGKAII